MSHWNKKIVWPKDGRKGHRKRGFVKGLGDILTGKGPDMFVQERRENIEAIDTDRWANWDSYHDWRFSNLESKQHNGLQSTSRGYKRYDPVTRKYRNWEIPFDYGGDGVHDERIGSNGAGYPRFTHNERRRLNSRVLNGRPLPSAESMGSDWTNYGPMRFDTQHNWFWRRAHRMGENWELDNLPPELYPPYSGMRMHQRNRDEWKDWV